MAIDSTLEQWSKVEERLNQDTQNQAEFGLLLGNGASRVIWDKFGYPSLYDLACNLQPPFSLNEQSQKIFTEFDTGTKNFEAILSHLATTGKITKILAGNPEDNIYQQARLHYGNVRESLIHAVHSIHVPFNSVSNQLKTNLRSIFGEFDYIYTTNYDLLLYWSLMDDREKFKDFFWSHATDDPENERVVFNSWNTDLWGNNETKVLYLHGALHLSRDMVNGETSKKKGEDGKLLEDFGKDKRRYPLFISEGTSKDKVWSIRRNDYLTFAYSRFANHRGSFVIFGQSLTPEYDQHIIDAMNNCVRYNQKRTHGRNFKRDIAISVYPHGQRRHDIVAFKARMRKLLHEAFTLHFFDSTTCIRDVFSSTVA